MRAWTRATVMIGALLLTSSGALAQESEGYTEQPYIDAIKERLEERPAPARSAGSPQPHIDSIKKGLPPEKEPDGSYTEAIRKRLFEDDDQKDGSYIAREKARLGPPPKESAIGKVYEGTSELKLKRNTEDIHHAAGFRLGTAFSFDITASAGVANQSFNTVYEDGWNPDFTLFYEYQPFHSEWLGNFGIWGSVGFSNFRGSGTFETAPPQAWPGGATFSTASRTRFNFTAVPVMIGVNYRMNVMRILRPYVMAAPALIGYLETRSDGGRSHRGNSRGIYFSGGAALLLDWISKDATWSLYQDLGVKHFYLTVEYVKLTTVSGDVDFDQNGIFSGLTFEF